jgi:hypothetical protein
MAGSGAGDATVRGASGMVEPTESGAGDGEDVIQCANTVCSAMTSTGLET